MVLCKSATVIHDARRDSRRNIKFLKWHLSSAATFFIKHGGRFPETDV